MLNASSVASTGHAILAAYVGFTLRRGATTAGRRRLAHALLMFAGFAICYGLTTVLPGRVASNLANVSCITFVVFSAWETLLYVRWLGRGAHLADEASAPRWAWLALFIPLSATVLYIAVALPFGFPSLAPQYALLFVDTALFATAFFVAVRAQRRGTRGAAMVAIACAPMFFASVANILASLRWIPAQPYFVFRDVCTLLSAFLLFVSYLDDGHEPMSIEGRVVAGSLTAVLFVESIASRMMELFLTAGASPADVVTLRFAIAWRFLALVVASGALVIVLVPRLFRRSVFRPLARLTGALAELERGDAHVALRVDHEDEIGRLTRSFNSMARSLADSKKSLEDKLTLLQSKQDEVEGLNEELRRQVIARSRQLSDVLGRVVPEGRTFEPGVTIDGRYRIDGRLGAGGMGVVYAATRLTDNKALALKVMAKGTAREDGVRFAREAEIAAGLAHENLVGVLDVGMHDGVAYLVMERVDGGSLEDARDRFGDVAWALPLLTQIAEGLVALHARSILHRDLKPANVLLSLRGRSIVAKISDFGIARQNAIDALAATISPDAKTEAPATAAGMLVGTLAYMAPELPRGVGATPASDIFAFGIVAYELLTKALPFAVPAVLQGLTGATLSEPPALPVDLTEPIAKALRATILADPAQRPTAHALTLILRD